MSQSDFHSCPQCTARFCLGTVGPMTVFFVRTRDGRNYFSSQLNTALMKTKENPNEVPTSEFATKVQCPICGSTDFELRNYDMMWHDGDIHCARCGEFIRKFDAG